MTTHTEDLQAAALSKLRENLGNVKLTAKQLGIPRTTLIGWRDKEAAVSDTIPAETRQRRIELWDKAQAALATRLIKLAETSDDIRAIAYAARVAVEAHLDYSEGRSRSTQLQQQNNFNGPIKVEFIDAWPNPTEPLPELTEAEEANRGTGVV